MLTVVRSSGAKATGLRLTSLLSYYEMLVLGSRPNISCLTMSPYIDEKAMKKFADKGGVDLQGAVPHILLKMAMTPV